MMQMTSRSRVLKVRASRAGILWETFPVVVEVRAKYAPIRGPTVKPREKDTPTIACWTSAFIRNYTYICHVHKRSYHSSVPSFWTRQISHDGSAEADVAFTDATNNPEQKEHAEALWDRPHCIRCHQPHLQHIQMLHKLHDFYNTLCTVYIQPILQIIMSSYININIYCSITNWPQKAAKDQQLLCPFELKAIPYEFWYRRVSN